MSIFLLSPFYLRSSSGFSCHCYIFWENWKLFVHRVFCSICRVSSYCRDLNRFANIRKNSGFKLFCFRRPQIFQSPIPTFFLLGTEPWLALKQEIIFHIYMYKKKLQFLLNIICFCRSCQLIAVTFDLHIWHLLFVSFFSSVKIT